MKIRSFELQHTNPSLGPYEKIITITLDNSPEHQERILQFLTEAKVNNTISLEQYIQAVIQNNEETLKAVYNNTPKITLMEGESISNFTIFLEGQASVGFDDVYRRYSISHFYGNFTKYMVDHGQRLEGDSADLFARIPIQKKEPPSTIE